MTRLTLTTERLTNPIGLFGAEPIVKDILDVLTGGLTDALATLATVNGVTVALPAPDAATGFHGYLTDPRLLPSWPAILVRRGPRSVIGEKDVNGGYELSNVVAVDIVVLGADNAILTTQMDRYVRAVCELLTVREALPSGQCDLVRVGYEEPQLTDRESGDYLQDVPCFFNVTTYEIAPQ